MTGSTPLPHGPAEHEAREPAKAESWRGHGTVLFVDDEESVLFVGKRMLEGVGLTVLTATSGEEALEIYSEKADEIRCVILDLTMPRMDGEETFRELRRVRDDAVVILSSGYSAHEVIHRFEDGRPSDFIQKPYRTARLIAKVREALGEA
ncbi:MAG: response regulator [Planctomycetota bacterium]